ncbi:hypothetical protein H2201_005914 [Coniosporium apollinis]|uniref:Uncharacterized protein n=1 Tax=Coniosporium apollinis TaxID=61459 RepID=A0ABQ9NQV3_9PEZI|nr:hypothetical protein H2201_005914 [Coniosporium apollinis]
MALRARAVLLAIVSLFLVYQVAAVVLEKDNVSIGQLTPGEIEEKLQSLNAHKVSTHPQTSSVTSRIFSFLFPGSPAVNALLATLYISGPPNFLLALCPPNIDPSSLSVMVAFAVGGLLGDTLFHLLPEIFLGEVEPDRVKFVMVEPNKNLLLGVAIMVGFVTFVAMDKGLRIATGGNGGHDHGHGHAHGKIEGGEKAAASAVASGSEVRAKQEAARQRKPNGTTTAPEPTSIAEKEVNASVKLGGYLNLIADFTHNITDGLALSSSFYASPTIGATTTVAVFFHEIPHEVGDFALLVQSGFSKRKAMGAQFLTAVGAFLGTCIGIAVQEFGGSSSGLGAEVHGPGLFGTSLQWGDMLLPFTAGTFLYVGTVAVIPEMLETGPDKGKEVSKTLTQFSAMAAGAGIMLAYVIPLALTVPGSNSTTPFQNLCNASAPRLDAPIRDPLANVLKVKCIANLGDQRNNLTYVCQPEVKSQVQTCVHSLCDANTYPAADAEYNAACASLPPPDPQPEPLFRNLCNVKCSVSLGNQANNQTHICRPDVRSQVQTCVHQLCDAATAAPADAEYEALCPTPPPQPLFKHLCNVKCAVGLGELAYNKTHICLPDVRAGVQTCVRQLCDASTAPVAEAEYEALCPRPEGVWLREGCNQKSLFAGHEKELD